MAAKAYLDKVPILGALNRNLTGAPDSVLTAALLGVALVALIVAFASPAVFKAAVLAWLIFP
jgi:uncharacterized MnhB-related membrane protein